jgi:gamma-glutamyltranspeptidase/glutathione hydrolase
MVAPSSGSVVLSALKIFGGFDGSAQDDDPAINLTTHRCKCSTIVERKT